MTTQQQERHLMVDIETLGILPNTAMFSLASVVFDINTGEIYDEFYELIDPSYADTGNTFSHSASTIAWWCKQSPEATEQLVKATEEGEDLIIALTHWKQFVTQSNAVNYWAKGQFDLPILSYHIAEFPYLLKSLDFRKFRDMRTTLAEADINPKTYPDSGVSHNALDDCKFQITCLVDAWKKVTSWKDDLYVIRIPSEGYLANESTTTNVLNARLFKGSDEVPDYLKQKGSYLQKLTDIISAIRAEGYTFS